MQGDYHLILFVFSSPAIPVVIATIEDTTAQFQSWVSSGKLKVAGLGMTLPLFASLSFIRLLKPGLYPDTSGRPFVCINASTFLGRKHL